MLMKKLFYLFPITAFIISGLLFAGCFGSSGNSGSDKKAPGQVSAPQFNPTEGTYSSDQSVIITCATVGATIHYTTDGTDPDASSASYSAPIAVNGSGTVMTIKAFAVKSGLTDSDIASATITINYSKVSTPQFSPAEGTYTSDQSVSITCGTDGASIYYTTDGSDPDVSSALYGSPVSVSGSGTMTIKAFAVKQGMADSGIASATYTIDYSKIAAPQFSLEEGSYSSDQSVAITCTTDGAAIYYTTDGSDPNISSTLYNSPVAVNGDWTTMIIKAFAVKQGMTDSDISGIKISINYSMVSTPEFDPGAGEYTGNQNVTIACSTPGADIRYTTDGSNPGETDGILYTAPVTVTSASFLKAIAYKQGMKDSTIASASYTFTTPAAPQIIGIISGNFKTDQAFTVTGRTDAVIEYSLNGGSSWMPYIDQVTISADGSYNVTTRQTANGKTSANSSVLNLVIDKTAPDPPAINNISSGTFGAAQHFTLTGSEMNMEYSTDGGTTWMEYTGEVELSDELTYTVTARQTDFVGNISTAATPVIVTINWPPVAGNSGALAASNVQNHSFWIGWTQASDTKTPQSQLQYKIVRSTSNNIATVTAAETAGGGRNLVRDWTTDLCWSGSTNKTTSWELIGLNNNTIYYFTVLVKDSAGSKSIYVVNSQATLSHNSLPFTNDIIKAMVTDGTNLYIGGYFTNIGATFNGAAIDCTGSGNLAASTIQPVVNDEIKAVISDGSGGWYIGGSFTNINGVERSHLARINADGSLHAWNPGGINATVYALAISGSTIYAGGDFTSIAGTTRNCLAEIDTNGNLLPWNPQAGDGDIVYALAVSDNTIYAGGHFSGIGGTTRHSLAAIDANGSLLSSFPDTDSEEDDTVYTLAVHGSTVYAGGEFYSIGGTTRNHLAAIGTSGTLSSWNPNPDGCVYALAVSGNMVYAGGDFSYIGKKTRYYLAAIDTDGISSSWNPSPDDRVNTLSIIGNTIYAGGDFSEIGGTPRTKLAAIGTDGTITSWNPNASPVPNSGGSVYAIAISGSTIYAGGVFSIGGETRNYLAAINADGTLSTSWNPGADGAVHALAICGSTVYAGGDFMAVGGYQRYFLAAIDTDGNTISTWDPCPDSTVYALATSGSTVYAGGNFYSMEWGATTRQFLAAIDSNGALLPWNPGADNRVYALATDGSTVYAGGDFSSINGTSRKNLAAISAADGSLLSWNPNANGRVSAIALSGTTVYAGGSFNAIGGIARNYLAAISMTDGTILPWNAPGADGRVYALAISGSTVYAGGEFYIIGGTERNRLAAIAMDANGTILPWNPDSDGSVFSIAVSGSTIYAGGYFNAIGGMPRVHISAIDLNGKPW